MRASLSLRPCRAAAQLAACLCLFLAASSAHARKPGDKKVAPSSAGAARGPVIDLKPVIGKLKSGDENQMRDALDEVRLAGPAGAPAAPMIAEALTRGLSLSLTQSAIETLGDLESEAG